MILLESSALIESFRKKGRADIRARVQAALLSSAAAICDPVLLEFYAGAAGRKELEMIADYEKNLPILPCDDKVWKLARDYARLFRSKGKPFSNFDILIFALTKRHNAGLITMDRAFRRMQELVTADSKPGYDVMAR